MQNKSAISVVSRLGSMRLGSTIVIIRQQYHWRNNFCILVEGTKKYGVICVSFWVGYTCRKEVDITGCSVEDGEWKV